MVNGNISTLTFINEWYRSLCFCTKLQIFSSLEKHKLLYYLSVTYTLHFQPKLGKVCCYGVEAVGNT